MFFFKIQKLKVFEITSQFFSVSSRSLLFSNFQLAMLLRTAMLNASDQRNFYVLNKNYLTIYETFFVISLV